MSESTSTPTTDESTTDGGAVGERVLYETGPSLRPAVVKLSAVLVAAVVVVGYVLTHPELFGSQQNTEIGAYVVAFVALVVLVRYAFRVYLLKRYRYTVTDDAVRWEYSLLYKTRSRELPFSKIRGHEFRQDRVESVLGFGTVAFLSGGTNQSLGFLTFENVANPDRVRETVREQLDD
jgi:membrane protein YdbS with pleckstrin-like domain